MAGNCQGDGVQGYLSFIVVFASLVLIFSLLEVQAASGSIDLSKAVSVERAYGVQMNAKEAAIESVRHGALYGFTEYDNSHDINLCRHCPDSFCIPSVPPAAPPNYCDPLLCSRCFREPDARMAAEQHAIAGLDLLRNHQFDADFELQLGQPSIEAFTRAEPLSKNGFALGHVRFRSDLAMNASSPKLGLSAYGRLPGGMVIDYGQSN